MRTLLFALVVAAGCATSDAAPGDKKPAAPVAKVELASVNLADDCAAPVAPAPAKAVTRPKVEAPANAPAAQDDTMPAGKRRAGSCDQTSMQLAFTVPAGAKGGTATVTKVELLDAKGKLLQTLTARAPQRFETDKYVAWDQQLAAGSSVQAMYTLTAPDWDKLGGRWSAHDKSFQLRVSVTVGTATQKVSLQAVVPARLAVPVPT